MLVCACDASLPTPEEGSPAPLPPAARDVAVHPPAGDLASVDSFDGSDDTGDAHSDTADVADTLRDTKADADAPGSDGDTADADTVAPCDDTTLGTRAACPARSCLQLRMANPSVTDGTYWIHPEGGGEVSDPQRSVEVECVMSGNGGGWTVVLDANYGEGDACPMPWGTADFGACMREIETAGAVSVEFPVPAGLAWSEVTGFFEGFRYATVDAFGTGMIDDVYTDGVSVTVGMPRQHIWTYTLGQREGVTFTHYVCPCSGSTSPAPAFVGAHYACEATGASEMRDQWVLDDSVWSGNGYGTDCDVHGSPSPFVRALATPVTDPIEVRLMADQPSSNEDIGLTRAVLAVREAERCDGSGAGLDDDHDGLVDEKGCGPANPAVSCRDVLEANAGGWAPDGTYWLQPRGTAGPMFQAWCDMTADGDPWTLAAVCRPHDAQCWKTTQVGEPTSPWVAKSVKIDDADIRAILYDGTVRETRGDWRQIGPGEFAVSGVAINAFDDPSVWTSTQCATPAGSVFHARVALDDTTADPDFDALLAQALAMPSDTAVVSGGSCFCNASGWSNNATGTSCQGGWSANCEGGPASLNDCATPVARADVLLWVR